MQRILAVAMGAGPRAGGSGIFRDLQKGQSKQVEVRPYVAGLIQGLKRLGLEDGRDYEIKYATCEPKTLRAMVKEALAEEGADAIFAMSTSAVKAAMAITKEIPIVFPSVSEPEQDKVVKSCAAPGTNVTGVRAMRSQTAGECLELFKATVPSLKKVFGLHKKDYPPAKEALKRLKPSIRKARVSFKPIVVASHRDIEAKLLEIAKKEAPGQAGVLVLPDDLVLSASRLIARLGQEKRLPTFFPTTDWVNSDSPSALGGYGVPQFACGEAAAAYIYKIFSKGVKANVLPVKRIGGFEWAVNTQVARAIGVDIPKNVLDAADRVI